MRTPPRRWSWRKLLRRESEGRQCATLSLDICISAPHCYTYRKQTPFTVDLSGASPINMKNLKFIHITKTAGTSIENIANKKGIKWGMFDPVYKKKRGGHGDPWHDVINLANDFDYFMVVRNPYDRIISEFHCEWGNKDIKNYKWSHEMFNSHINKKIKESMISLRRGGHYYPQYLYLNDNIKIHVLKFENLKSDFDSLMKIYNIDLTLDRLDNFNNKIFGVKDIDHENIKLINEYFNKDFQLFSYNKMSISVASDA